MSPYAADTSVSVIKTRMEIEALLTKLGCQEFGSSQDEKEAHVFFRKDNWRVQLHMKLPTFKQLEAEHYKKTWRALGKEAGQAKLEQRQRSSWRGLLLVLKAKFAALENGVETFEEAFMAHIVLHNGMTIGQAALPKMRDLVQRDQPLMLGTGDAHG